MFTTASFTSNSTPLFNIEYQPTWYSIDSFASMQEQQAEQHHSNLSPETRSSTNFELTHSRTPDLVEWSYQSPGEYQDPPPLLNQAQPPYPPQNYALHLRECEEPQGFWHDYDDSKAIEEEKKHSQERAEELQESLL